MSGSRAAKRDAEMAALLGRFVAWANGREDVRAAFVVGSRARTGVPADEFSDLDLVFFCTDPSRYVEDDYWLRELGEPVLSFLEPTSSGTATERRTLFAPDLDVDFVPLPTDIMDELASLEPGEAAKRLAGAPGFTRGVRVVLDKDGLLGGLSRFPKERAASRPPTEKEYAQVVNEFLYCKLWASRKLARGELWTAKGAVDGRMKSGCLLPMAEWHAKCRRGWTYDTWHDGRFLDTWAEPDVLERLESIHAKYGADDIERALAETHALFRALALEVGDCLGYEYPSEADARISELAGGVLARRRKVK